MPDEAAPDRMTHVEPRTGGTAAVHPSTIALTSVLNFDTRREHTSMRRHPTAELRRSRILVLTDTKRTASTSRNGMRAECSMIRIDGLHRMYPAIRSAEMSGNSHAPSAASVRPLESRSAPHGQSNLQRFRRRPGRVSSSRWPGCRGCCGGPIRRGCCRPRAGLPGCFSSIFRMGCLPGSIRTRCSFPAPTASARS